MANLYKLSVQLQDRSYQLYYIVANYPPSSAEWCEYITRKSSTQVGGVNPHKEAFNIITELYNVAQKEIKERPRNMFFPQLYDYRQTEQTSYITIGDYQYSVTLQKFECKIML